jgi:hypothetical protein
MKTRSDKGGQLAATAYHEAGHAAAAWLLNIRLRKVTIVPEGDALGYVLRRGIAFPKRVRETLECGAISDRDKAWAQFIAERHAVICLAGNEAQKRFNPRSVRRAHSQSDCDSALNGLLYMEGPDTMHLYWRILTIRAKCLLNRPGIWDAVKALAEALMQQKTMSGDDSLKIMRRSSDSKCNLPPLKIS